MSVATVQGPALQVPPEDALYEMVDGRYVELPPMSTQAVLVAFNLGFAMQNYAKAHDLGSVAMEALFGITSNSRRMHRPDLAFVSYRRWAKNRPVPKTDPWPVVPELAVEVVSPSDVAESLQRKVAEYLDAGVSLVWLIYPQLTWVLAYESRSRVRGFSLTDDLDAEAVLPGFRLPLSELFSGQTAPSSPDNGEIPPEIEDNPEA